MDVRKVSLVDKTWGVEEHIVNSSDKGFCGKLLKLKAGFRSSVHRHPKDETFFILSGRVFLEMENDEEMEGQILEEGDIVDIFDSKWHRFNGLKDSVIVEFSSPDCESERKTQSSKIPDFENWRLEIENGR